VIVIAVDSHSVYTNRALKANSIKVYNCFLEQETLPFLLSTGSRLVTGTDSNLN